MEPSEKGERGTLSLEREALSYLSVHSFELVPGPLQRVLDGIWEVFECADGDGLLRGVPGAGVRLSHVGKDDLCVALGAEGARLKEGLAVVNTPRGYNMNL